MQLYYVLLTSSTLAREVQANRFKGFCYFSLRTPLCGCPFWFTSINLPVLVSLFTHWSVFGLRTCERSLTAPLRCPSPGVPFFAIFLYLAHKLFHTKAFVFCPRNKFGSNAINSTFTVENMILPGKMIFNHPKLYSISFGFFIKAF